MKRAGKQPGKEALDLIEEAAHVLRTAPAGTLVAYYVGALPFVLGGLYFWADMSRSPYAAQHLGEATLGMAGLFVWMKFWQAMFARRVRAFIGREGVPSWSWRRCGRLLLAQMALQSSGLFVLPLASVPLLPTPWVYAFYQNLTVLDDGESGELRALLHKARRQAALWPRQNHLLLALLLAFGFCVFLNWAMVSFMLPVLLKTLFGVESIFTRASWRMLNTTFFAGMFGLTYLSVDPMIKVAYALRCFYGESVQSGEDLKSGLREFVAPVQAVAVGVLVTLGALGAMGVCRGADLAGIPTGFHPSAQGCAERATLGNRSVLTSTLKGLRPVNPHTGSSPFRVAGLATVFPRVARAAQPWAERGHSFRMLRGQSRTVRCFLSHGERDGQRQGLKPMATARPSLRDAAPEEATPNPERGTAQRRVGEVAPSVSAPKLDSTIEQVIQESKYAWRAPREKVLPAADEDQGLIARFLERVWNLFKGALKQVGHWLGKAFEWLGTWLGKIFGRFFRMPAPTAPGYGWIMSLNIMLYVLVAAVILGLLYLAYHIWRSRRRGAEVIASEPILPVPDVADENVGADQLPEEGWMKLGRELLGRGELRLALRAFYLASLAHLAERNLISIAKSKSNREYERELLRRGHSFPELLAVFGQNVTVFDRTWYGLHEVNPELVTEFAGRVEQIKGVSANGQPARGGAA